MKKLDQFILKTFVGQFLAILAIVTFILVMQFLWLYIDELVGKGLELKVILEFLMWGGFQTLPLAIPLATLLSSMMTLGDMGEHFELTAMKASGISLARVLVPMAHDHRKPFHMRGRFLRGRQAGSLFNQPDLHHEG